jgi:hypothetical protein
MSDEMGIQRSIFHVRLRLHIPKEEDTVHYGALDGLT